MCRVFKFEEGDQGSRSCTSKSLMKVFVQGITLTHTVTHMCIVMIALLHFSMFCATKLLHIC